MSSTAPPAAPAATTTVVEKPAPASVVVERPATAVAPSPAPSSAAVAVAPSVAMAQPLTMNTNPPVVDKIIAMPGNSQPAPVATNTTIIEEKRPALASRRTTAEKSLFRGHIIAFIGELIGTFMFLSLAFAGTQIALDVSAFEEEGANKSLGTLVYIALAFGFSLTVTAWIFYRITGGMFNPAVTLGLALIGCLPYGRAFVVFLAQMIGSVLAAAFIDALLPGYLHVSTEVAPDLHLARAVFLEMFLTFVLITTIFFLAVEKHRGTFLAPLGIGLALFVCELVGVPYTGGSLNPARSFGASAAVRWNENYWPDFHWVYWLGPLLGALLAVIFYRLMKVLEYDVYGDVGQDADSVQPASDLEDTIVESQNTTTNTPAARALPRGLV